MAEAIRPKKKPNLKVTDEDIAKLQALPVIDDALPSYPAPNTTQELTPSASSCGFDAPRSGSIQSQCSPPAVSVVTTTENTGYESNTVTETTDDEIPLASTACEVSAPVLLEPAVSPEDFFEFQLPDCYTVAELQNFYSNQTADNFSNLEQAFLEETSLDAVSLTSFSTEINLMQYQRPVVDTKIPLHEHPLYRLICTHANDRAIWHRSINACRQKQESVSQQEQTAWMLERLTQQHTGKCRDGCTVGLTYEQTKATLRVDALPNLCTSHEDLKNHLFDEISSKAFRVAFSRLEVESYLARTLKLCPEFARFARTEPIILLSEQNVSPSMTTQIQELRLTSSVLFACLHRFSQGNHDTIDEELINDVIGWIFDITGRLVRQCRMEDHLYVAMQLLRLPFSLKYSTRYPPLASLLQPPDLDIAWARANSQPATFIEELEVELRASLVALCLRTPVRNRTATMKSVRATQESSTGPPADQPRPFSPTNDHSSPNKWTLVDSGGESEDELSATSTSSAVSSSTHPVTSRPGCFNSHPTPTTVVENVVCLLDQVGIQDLVTFLFEHWSRSTVAEMEIDEKRSLLPVFAFANWLLSVLENAKSLGMGNCTSASYLRIERQLSKRLAGIVSLLIRGVYSCLIDCLRSSRLSEQSIPPRHRLYPLLTPQEDEKVLLAQYDHLCLRSAELMLFSGSGAQLNVEGPCRLVCWRRLSTLMPFHLCSSRSKLRLYQLLLSSVSAKAGDLEADYLEEHYLGRAGGEAATAYVDLKVLSFDATQSPNDSDPLHQVLALLRSELIEADLGQSGTDAFVLSLGQLASAEFRPSPIPVLENGQRAWSVSKLPTLEHLLVRRIINLLFKLCVVPTLHQKEMSAPASVPSTFAAVPLSATLGRDQLVSIVSAHTTFAFQHLFDLIVAAASHVDKLTASSPSSVSSVLPQRPDLSSADSGSLLLDLVEALPLRLFQATAEDLGQILCWIGGYSESELVPLQSIRSRLARSLLSHLPWEAVVNTTGEPLIPHKLQNRVAIAIAQSFSRHIIEPSRGAVHSVVHLSKITDAVRSATTMAGSFVAGFIPVAVSARSPRRLQASPGPRSSNRRSNSHSPLQLCSPHFSAPIRIPADPEVANLYHWTISMILKLRLKPNSGDLTRLLTSTGIPTTLVGQQHSTKVLENPITAFLALEFQTSLPNQTVPRVVTDRSTAELLFLMAEAGHFLLAIEAFNRLCLADYVLDTKTLQRQSKMRPFRSAIAICPAFFQFVSCILEANESSASSVWTSLWTAASATVAKRLLPSQSTSTVRKVSTTKKIIPGPVVEGFLGAVMNVCLAAGEASASFLRAIVSSILLFTLPKSFSSGWQNNFRANWLLDHILRTAYWLNAACVHSTSLNALEEWWYSPVGQELRPSLLTRSEVGIQAMPTEEPSDLTEGLNPVNESSNWGFYRLLSSSWADGLSTLIPANELSRLVWGQRGGLKVDDADGVNSTLICSLVSSAAMSETSNGEVSSSGCFWLIAYLIGADNNPEDRFGGFTIWNDIMHTVIWNRTQLLSQLTAQTEPPPTESSELSLEEKALIDVLTNGGLLSVDAQPAAVRENLLRLTRRLPLIQAVSALSICPLEHPAFFLLLHICLSQCLHFPRTSTLPRCGEGNQENSEECFPPGFLLLKLLRWMGCLTLDSQESQSVHSQPTMTLSVFDALVGRLRDALQYWLKRDSQDDSEDPYGLRSSAAVSFFRSTINLLSDLNQTVLHGQHDVDGALVIRTRIEQFDPSGALKAVNVDSILSSMYTEIAKWNSAKLSDTFKATLTLTTKTGIKEMCPKFSRFKISDAALREFNECFLIGQDVVEIDRLQLEVQKCVSKLHRAAAASIERNRRLESLQKVLRENILPCLYRDVKVQRSEVVNCKSYLPVSFPGSKACAGGARITVEYQTAELEEPVEKERRTNHQDTTALIGDILSSSSILAAVSAETEGASSLASSTSFLARKPPENVHWILNGFQLFALLRRFVEIRQTLHSQPDQRQTVTGHLLSIFNQLCQALSGTVFIFPPSRAILSKSVDLLASDLFSSGECQFDILLDVLTRSPQLTQLLTLRISPQLPQLKSFDLSSPRVNILTSIFRRLPLIYAQCGLQGTLDLLSQVQFESAASSITQVGSTVSASDLNQLTKDALGCLVEIKRIAVSSPSNADADGCGADESLLQLLRTHVSKYICANFPSSVIHLLEFSKNSENEHLHAELWPLVHAALRSDIESHGECSLAVNEVVSLLKQVNHCGFSTASLILGSTQSSSVWRGQILRLAIDCVGLLTEQLSAKVCRAVDATHMRASEALQLLHESIFSGLWTWVRRVGSKPSSSLLPAPAANQSSQTGTAEIPLVCICIQHLSSTLASVRRNCPSMEHLSITDSLVDAVVSSLFTRKLEATDNFYEVTVLIEEAEKQAETLQTPGFPWIFWHPSVHTIQLLNDAVRDVLGCSSQPPTGALTATDTRAPVLLIGTARLLSVARVHEKPESLITLPSPSVVSVPEFPNGLLLLAVALVALFDRLSHPSSFSKGSAKVSTTLQCTSDLHSLLANLRTCFHTYRISLPTLKTALHDVKSLLPPACVLQPEGTVVFELLSLLSVASSMQRPLRPSSRSDDDIRANSRMPYPSFPADADTPTSASTSDDVFQRRLAYIAFMVELLLLTPITTSATGCGDAAALACTATPDPSVTAGDAVPTTSVLSRAMLLLGNLVKPAGSAAGYLMSSLSATALWQRVSTGIYGDVNSDGAEANRLVGAFSSRVCGIFSELEDSCLQTGWEPVESDGFSEAVELCEALLRIRTESGRLLTSERSTCISALFDMLLICWLSRGGTLPDSSALPIGSLPIRSPAPVICRPLLCALFFHLPDAFKNSTSACATGTTAPAPSSVSIRDTPRSVTTIIDLIDACIWCALQGGTLTCESSRYKDTCHRIRLLSALFVLQVPGATAGAERPHRGLFVRLHDCVAWLVPACLVCRKLLPLCLYALARDVRISDAFPNEGTADRLRVDSPAILVADIMHWLSSTRLRSSDFDSFSGAESSQLTALLLLIHLVIQQVSRIKANSSGRVDASRNLVLRLIEWMNSLSKGWCQESLTASSKRKETEFLDRYD
uniref:Ectopic P granules protein 5 homolog n=1 Tax=Schistocephalus solidus TaxID=70667 RepID=A0A0X3NUF9_SCHSO